MARKLTTLNTNLFKLTNHIKRSLRLLYDRQLWDELEGCKTPLSIIVGENDTKFKKIAQKILSKMDVSRKIRDGAVVELHEIVEIPDSGHAAHLENPLAVINALSRFLIRRTQFSSNSDSAGTIFITFDIPAY